MQLSPGRFLMHQDGDTVGFLASSAADRPNSDSVIAFGIEIVTSKEKTPTGANIDFVLTEARVVLPGAQALLGF
ncbi:hypothetical protein ASE04_18895 [Rhizobium sp. Root708]|nr:hypothetical protein ASE04_18895 [Rhizobium sp. Root708]